MCAWSSEENKCREHWVICCTLPDLWMNCKPELSVISVSQSLTASNFDVSQGSFQYGLQQQNAIGFPALAEETIVQFSFF